MTFKGYLPQYEEWIGHLEHQWLGPIFKPYFAHLEVWHIISLFILGGCMILINLRLLGVGLTSEPPSVIEKNVRPWLNFGIFGVLTSGVLIGFANAQKLYDSPAFTAKMVALLAAIIFTYVVCTPTAKADGRVGTTAKVGAVLALVLWIVSLWIFTAVEGLAPGVVLVILAAGAMVTATLRGKVRWVYLAGLAAIIIAHQIVTHVVVTPETNYDGWVVAAQWFTRAEALWIVLFGGYQIFGYRNELAGGPMTRVIGFSSLLVWITVAAAGRWIAFAS